jgi:hypothetical protein
MNLMSYFFLIGTCKYFAVKRGVDCLEDGRFYRNPERNMNQAWTSHECSKYYLCLGKAVHLFRLFQSHLESNQQFKLARVGDQRAINQKSRAARLGYFTMGAALISGSVACDIITALQV